MPVLWRTAANCPVTCPQGMVFKEKTSACAATCEVPDGPEKCAYPDTENCVCPDDMVVINGTCQKPEMCTCPGGRPVGSSWLSIDCKRRYACEPCKECSKRKVARVYGYQHTCASNEVCVKVGDMGRCQTCQVDGSWGPWTEWSTCNSTRQQSRQRSCDHPLPQCGGASCPGPNEQSQKCFIVPTNAIVPDPPDCDTDFDFQRACDECDLYKNPNMFVANPCSCGTYYQCRRNQFFGYYYDVYERPCDPCTCWNQEKLTCDHDPEGKNPNHENCTLHLVTPSSVSHHGLYCYVNGRRFKAIPSKPHMYIDLDAGGIEMPCPPGTVFNVVACHCIHYWPPVVEERKPIMCLDFNDRKHPLKTKQGIYVTWTLWSTSSLLEAGVDGTALRFNGDRLEIPYFNNKEIKKLTVSLWYRRDSSQPQQQTLVSYGHCNDSIPPSILIHTDPYYLQGAFKASGHHVSTASTLNEWHHVAVTYDSHVTKLYLDGQLKGSVPSGGPIQYVHCPMVIGSQYKDNYFYGLMDEICFYENVLTDSEVKTLYDAHSLN